VKVIAGKSVIVGVNEGYKGMKKGMKLEQQSLEMLTKTSAGRKAHRFNSRLERG